MAKDFFGYTKDAKGPGNVVSPTMVILSIDGKKLRLAQSASVSYQRQVEPTYEIGSDSVWMVAGKSSGTCEVQRAIGNAEGGVEAEGAYGRFAVALLGLAQALFADKAGRGGQHLPVSVLILFMHGYPRRGTLIARDHK